jgi:hypothetical protein
MPTKVSGFTFRDRLTARDWADMEWYRLAMQFTKGLRWATGVLLKAVAAVCLGMMVVYGANIPLAWGFVISTALAVWMVFLPLLVRARAVDYYRRNEKGFLETVVSLTEGGVCVANARSQWELPWTKVALVADTPKGLLFCRQGRQPLFWLPIRVFSEDVTCHEVRMLLEAKGVLVRQVS